MDRVIAAAIRYAVRPTAAGGAASPSSIVGEGTVESPCAVFCAGAGVFTGCLEACVAE